MTVRDYAERILLANSLEEKLAPPPSGLTLDPPRKGGFLAPELPGRPEELRPRKPGDPRTKLPSAEQLSSEEHRATLLHFFCNHELLAVELMALALLKFPDAPDAFRRGLLHTLQDEQEHTRLYCDRMAATGTRFGDHSLSSMIWDHIAPMSSPLEYVSRLSLTFEQGNLDFARHYSKAFAQAGDQDSADLLAKIYHDEIAHVGYGLRWLRRFKEQKDSDWNAWHNALARPLTPIRAKAPDGEIDFNEEGRRRAGLDEDFIQKLKLYRRSRGRTPHLHFFNPDGEAHALASLTGRRYQPTQKDQHLAEDLEALILAAAHHEDIALLRKPPSQAHLKHLTEAGLVLPEILPCDGKALPPELADRKLGGFRPWAWTPDTSALFHPLAENPSSNSLHPWREALSPDLLSKTLTSRATKALALKNNESFPFSEESAALTFVTNYLVEKNTPLLLKPGLACAGRGQQQIHPDTPSTLYQKWLRKAFLEASVVVIEPLLSRLADFSILYELSSNRRVRFLSYTRLHTDARGSYLGSTVAPKIGKLLPPDLTVLFHQPCIEANGETFSAPHFYHQILPEALPRLLPGYEGPVAVDAFFHQQGESDPSPSLRPIVEINARCSMGRIAHHLRRKLAPDSTGRLTIHRLKNLEGQIPSGLVLNDPSTARSFLATWETTNES